MYLNLADAISPGAISRAHVRVIALCCREFPERVFEARITGRGCIACVAFEFYLFLVIAPFAALLSTTVKMIG